MNKLEQLKQEIQRLKPEIMELKFGCMVDVNNITMVNGVHKFCGKDIYNDGNYIAMLYDGCCVSMDINDTNKEKYGIKILGRPITLEDVLAVLGDGYAHETTRIDKGIFYWRFDSPEVGFDWLLGKPIDDQSEETINFLHSLIVN